MIKQSISALAACLLAVACSSGAEEDPREPSSETPALATGAPDFAGISHWLNSEPLTMQQLRGKVVLVEFWTYECINCIRVMPYVKQWHERYKNQGLVVVGVHTPEYRHERILANLQAAVQRFGIEYPVAQDNGYHTWNAFGNRYWPALYLIDQRGQIVYRHAGEGNYATTEAQIQRLLRKSPSGV